MLFKSLAISYENIISLLLLTSNEFVLTNIAYYAGLIHPDITKSLY